MVFSVVVNLSIAHVYSITVLESVILMWLNRLVSKNITCLISRQWNIVVGSYISRLLRRNSLGRKAHHFLHWTSPGLPKARFLPLPLLLDSSELEFFRPGSKKRTKEMPATSTTTTVIAMTLYFMNTPPLLLLCPGWSSILSLPSISTAWSIYKRVEYLYRLNLVYISFSYVEWISMTVLLMEGGSAESMRCLRAPPPLSLLWHPPFSPACFFALTPLLLPFPNGEPGPWFRDKRYLLADLLVR